jgi:hypothetical protein
VNGATALTMVVTALSKLFMRRGVRHAADLKRSHYLLQIAEFRVIESRILCSGVCTYSTNVLYDFAYVRLLQIHINCCRTDRIVNVIGVRGYFPCISLNIHHVSDKSC